MRHRLAVGSILSIISVFAGPVARGQSTMEAPVGQDVPYALDTGVLDNPTGQWQLVFSGEVVAEGADWLRIFFAQASLAPQSVLYITSGTDGAMQVLDATALAQWKSTSAYFNGDRVTLELYAAPGTKGHRLVIDHLSIPAADGSVAGLCGVCDGDDRVLSEEAWVGRSLPVGCTASMYTPTGCMLTAGHCLGGSNVVEFNVPPSLPNGQIQHPGPQDQYAVDSSTKVGQNGGVGADWAHFWCFPNSITGLLPVEKQGEYRSIGAIPTQLPAPIVVWGYGIADVGIMNQSQKLSVGILLSENQGGANNCSLSHTADTTGGNSGSPLLYNDQIIGIVTHCQCPNIATCIDLPQLQDALASCPEDGRGDCNGDLDVDLMDTASYQNCFSMPGSGACACMDVVENGTVNKADLGLLDAILAGPKCVPALAAPLTSQPVCPGDYVAMEAGHVGSFDLAYQWYVDGDPIEGASGDELLISAFSAGDVGSYRVQASNICGLSLSNSAQLTLCSASILSTNFESEDGWTVINDPAMTRGMWNLGVPKLVMDGATVVQPGSGNPNDGGTKCFVTGSPGGLPSSNDVDGGPTQLFSPTFDATGHAAVYLRYAYWFYRDNADGDDALIVSVSSNGGQTYTTIYEHRDNTIAWEEHLIKLNGLVALTNQMQIRYSIIDAAGDTILEALVDDVRIMGVD